MLGAIVEKGRLLESYVNNIRVAVLLFPLFSALLSLPYAIYQYRRYGSISAWKTFLVASFIFYLMCAYFMVILPLPADRTIYVPGAQHPQLVPFRFMQQLEASGIENIASVSGLLAFLRLPAVYTVYFNVLLTVPFGVYLRYLFHRRWWQALLLGFGLTLFFELSQFTGLFGIYEHPYRLFDVDDLITNTAGAMLGFWLSFPLCRFLPDLRDVDERSIVRGSEHTSFTRRLLAFVIDIIACRLVSLAWQGVVMRGIAGKYEGLIAALVATGVVFMIVPCITRGQTIGHMVLRLRVVRPDGSSAPSWAYIARYGLLFWVFLLLPTWVGALFPSSGVPLSGRADEFLLGPGTVEAILSSVYVVWLLSVGLRALLSAFKRPFVMLNGVMTNTRVMSEAQIERLRAERNVQSLEDELAQNDLGANSLEDAFDTSFDSVYSDELDADIDEARANDE
ncbi:VanZ family protein [Enorma sp.]|uniref:VanZ family protein n=1 Tax=Enorma sp. TaxID=1920692 RepID=UPI0025BD5C2D|nr:VanZ family protein [Enorma sp.]